MTSNEIVKQAIHSSFYVDDYLISFDNEVDAFNVPKEVINTVATGGFKLTKFISNADCISKELGSNDNSTIITNNGININADTDSLDNVTTPMLSTAGAPVQHVNRALGVKWNLTSDTFGFNVKIDVLLESINKRNMLKILASIHDPLGIAAPILVTAKKMFQDSCRFKLGWDTPVGEVLSSL